MALRLLVVSMQILPSCSPSFSCCLNPCFWSKELPTKVLQFHISRRMGTIAAVTSVLLAREVLFITKSASALTLEHALEEAESGLNAHARSLLEVKSLLDSEYWVEAQKELRRSSSNLKQDFYTIIQNKPGSERPLLRQLYSNLFNSITKLDYAARDRDVSRVQQLYDVVIVALEDILSQL